MNYNYEQIDGSCCTGFTGLTTSTSGEQTIEWNSTWSIAEDIDLVVRCELDGVMNYKGEEQLLLIKALNEYDSKVTGKLLLYRSWQ